MAQWQEKGGEPNSLFGLILFWNICGGSNPRGEKKMSSYFRQDSQDRKREQIFPVKEAGTSLLTFAPLYELIICLNFERNRTLRGQGLVKKMEQTECFSFEKV